MKPLINKRSLFKKAKYKFSWYKSMKTMLKNKRVKNITDKTIEKT